MATLDIDREMESSRLRAEADGQRLAEEAEAEYDRLKMSDAFGTLVAEHPESETRKELDRLILQHIQDCGCAILDRYEHGDAKSAWLNDLCEKGKR